MNYSNQDYESKNQDTFLFDFEKTLEEISALFFLTNTKTIISKIDNTFLEKSLFSNSDIYLLYGIFFELWSIQHNAILYAIRTPSLQYSENQLTLQEHTRIFYNLDEATNQLCKNHLNPQELRNEYLKIWKKGLHEIRPFKKYLFFPKKYRNRQNFIQSFWNNSPAEAFITLMTILGLIVAILLLKLG